MQSVRRRIAAVFATSAMVVGLFAVAPSTPAAALYTPTEKNMFGAAVPSTPDGGTTGSAMVGTRFTVLQPGSFTGVRFYKSAANTGTHIGYLYDVISGSPLRTVTFTGESASGWQEATFSSPLNVDANLTYIVAYYAPNGHFASDANYFSANPSAYPFEYNNQAGGFSSGAAGIKPNDTTTATNYYVDPIFLPDAGAPCPCNRFASNYSPVNTDSGSNTPNELGMKFSTYRSGFIYGVRFHKGANNTGVHTGRLWDASTNQQLASVVFQNETATGWQYQAFATPIQILENHSYVVSYSATNGGFSYEASYFSGDYNVAPVHTGQDAGVFSTSIGGFPDQTYNRNNYGVDIDFRDDNPTAVTFSATVNPVVSLSVAGYNAGSCNGTALTQTSSTATASPLGQLSAASASVSGQALTVSSNSVGYTIFVRSTGPLSSGSNSVANWTGTKRRTDSICRTRNPCVWLHHRPCVERFVFEVLDEQVGRVHDNKY